MLVNTAYVKERDLNEIEKVLSTKPPAGQPELFDEIRSVCIDKLGHCVIARRQSDLVGFAVFKRLEWDTDHFGINIGRLSTLASSLTGQEAVAVKGQMIKFIEARCIEEGFGCVYCRLGSNDLTSTHALEANNFRLIDVLTTLRFDFGKGLADNKLLERGAPVPDRVRSIVRPWREEDLKELAGIASSCYQYDRFHSDPMFSQDKSDELHGNWIVNCCRRLANEVLVAVSGNKPIGFITCKVDNSLGIIDMVGVSRDAQKNGIGSILTYHALEWFKGKVDSVDVGTQNRNIPALRLYLNAGFRPISCQLTFHRWLTEPNLTYAE